MDINTARARLQAVLDTKKDRYTKLSELVVKLRDEGLTQIDIYMLFSEFQGVLDPESMEYDCIVETMISIWSGPSCKAKELFGHELTNQEIADYRNNK